MKLFTDNTGRVLIRAVPPIPLSNISNAGIRQSNDAYTYTTTGAGNVNVAGFRLTNDGYLCISTGLAILNYIAGLPVGALGVLRVYTDVVVPAGTPFVAGIAVGPLGVYCATTGVAVSATELVEGEDALVDLQFGSELPEHYRTLLGEFDEPS